MPRPSVEIDTAVLNRILRNLPGNAEAAVRRVALDVSEAAKLKAPVDTGALQNSIDARQVSPTEYHVGPTVDYGVYVELGTRYMAAQPYLGPAVRSVEAGLIAAFGDVVTDGG
jgi:HK97 gp10 family phage protein